MGVDAPKPFRVGEWNVVPATSQLERGQETVRLGPTILQVLLTLAARPGEVMTREEILEAVWKGTFVVDEVLSNAIWELRRALGDDVKSPRYIQTVPKNGYRLIAVVEPSSTLPPAASSWKAAWTWLALPVVGVLTFILWRLWPDTPVVILEPVRITFLDGRERAPALSRDGRRVAFFTSFDLHVVSAQGGDPLVVASVGPDGYLGSAAWSPDGEWIAFSRWSMHDVLSKEIRMVRALGGSERLVTTTLGYAGDIDWSPDGEWLAVSSKKSRDEPEAISLYSVDTGLERRLTDPVGPPKSGDRQPRFSRDGGRVAFLRREPALQEPSSSIYVQTLEGTEKALRVTPASVRFHSFDWLADASGFVASVEDRIYRVSLASGELIPLPFPKGVRDVSTEGERLVYRAGSLDTDIWRIPGPAGEPGGERAPWITSRAQELLPRYSPDGSRVLFTSDRSGSWEVWICDAGASNRNCRQLTFEGEAAGAATWSPDGRRIMYVGGMRSPTPGLYVMDVDGGVPERLSPEDQPTGAPFWSADGTALYYGVGLDDSPEIWRTSLPSRQTSRIGDVRGLRPILSEDGRFLYYSKSWGSSPIARVPLAGGAEEIVLKKAPGHFEWDLWKNHLVYLLWDLPYVIEALDLETGETTTLATLPDDYTPEMGLSVSPDGHWILLTREEDEWDVLLVEDYLSAIPR